jgi:hypothetical protein
MEKERASLSLVWSLMAWWKGPRLSDRCRCSASPYRNRLGLAFQIVRRVNNKMPFGPSRKIEHIGESWENHSQDEIWKLLRRYVKMTRTHDHEMCRNFSMSDRMGYRMNSWASDSGIVSQLSRLEHQMSPKESNLHSQWRKLEQQILERKRWKTIKNINIFQIIGMDQMEQRSVVLSLWLKDLSRKAIHQEFVAVLQENAVLYSSLMRCYSARRPF